MEPPVSDAVAAKHRLADTALAEPPDEPPGVNGSVLPLGAPWVGDWAIEGGFIR